MLKNFPDEIFCKRACQNVFVSADLILSALIGNFVCVKIAAITVAALSI
jgi:hypothetical protein